MIKLAINGCCGKMGKRIMELAVAGSDYEVVTGLEKTGHPALHTDVKGVTIRDDFNLIKNADVVIDFTGPQASMDLLEVALKHKKALVIGTTGLTHEETQRIKEAGTLIPIVFSPNMSVGVNILFRLVKEAAAKLKEYHISITEAHHVHKKDAPSGTARKLAQIIQDQANRQIEDIEAIREGEIIGDHKVKFESELDTIVLSHSAKTRDIFAKGALEAAKWVAAKQVPGLYSMQDVLS